MNKAIIGIAALFLSVLVFTELAVKGVLGAPADGTGPWADSVKSFSQALTKNGDSIPADRSNPEAAVGVAENDDSAGSFVSLGFGGSIELGFQNPVNGGFLVIETTYDQDNYPVETAKVEVSENGVDWIEAGTVERDDSVLMPEQIECAAFVRITDTSNADLFDDDITSDGYDVDGVKSLGSEPCDPGSGGAGNPDSSPTPTPTPNPEASGSSDNGDSDSGESNDNTSSKPDGWACAVAVPPTPQIRGVRTSGSTVELYWDKVEPSTHYSVVYGLNPGEYMYGVADMGNTDSFVIGGLDQNSGYYFVVRAVNDCAPSEASNEFYIGPEATLVASAPNGDVLGISTDELAATGSMSNLMHLIYAGMASVITWFAADKILA